MKWSLPQSDPAHGPYLSTPKLCSSILGFISFTFGKIFSKRRGHLSSPRTDMQDEGKNISKEGRDFYSKLKQTVVHLESKGLEFIAYQLPT